MAYTWRWGVFLQPVPSGGATYLDWMLAGLEVTAALSLTSWIIALAVGSIMGVLRTVPSRSLNFVAAAYVELFRNVPLLVQLLVWYFVVPEVVPTRLGSWMKATSPFLQGFFAATACLSLFTGARVAEQVRAGIQSLSKGQKAAALALGMPYGQAMRLVILPQAFRNMIPLLLTQGIILFQDTSLVYVSALSDFFGTATKIGDRDGRMVEMLLFAGAVYFLICYAASSLVRLWQKRLALK